MSGWLWAGIVLLLLVLLFVSRVKVCIRYGAEGGSLKAGFGVLTLISLPEETPEGGEEHGERKKKAKKDQKEKKQTGGGSVPGFRDLVSIILELAGKLRRRLCVDELTLWYQSAGEDPAAAALAFGGASAAAGLLLQPLEACFRIRKRDVRTAVSFTDPKPTVIACLRLSLRFYQVLYLGLTALMLWKKARKRAADTEE